MEHKTFPALTTKVDGDQGVVEAIVAVMGNIDAGSDRIEPGAFRKTLAEHGHKVKVLDQHNTNSVLCVVGKPIEIREVDRSALPAALVMEYPTANGGLYTKTQYLTETPEGMGVFQRIKAGAIDQYSIGYDTIKGGVDYETLTDKDGTHTTRVLKELRLFEYSPCVWAMNSATTTLSAKSAPTASKPYSTFPIGEEYCVFRVDADGNQQGESLGCHATQGEADAQILALYANEAKAATGKADLPIGDRNAAWDDTAANARVRDWAGGDNLDFNKYKQAFFWYDATEPELLGSYKLQFADVVDGKLTAMPRGIFASAAAIQGSRGGVDLPAGDVDGVKSKIAGYYTRMAKEFDDDGIVAPWDKAKSAKAVNLTERIDDVRSAFNAQYNPTQGSWVYWVTVVYDEYVVVQYESADGQAYYQVAYALSDDRSVTFAPRTEWIEGDFLFVPNAQKALRGNKAGRVLAQRNVDRISAAVAMLLEALGDAGVELGNDEGRAMGEDEGARRRDEEDKSGPNETTPPTSSEAGPGGEKSPETDAATLLQEIQLLESELSLVEV